MLHVVYAGMICMEFINMEKLLAQLFGQISMAWFCLGDCSHPYALYQTEVIFLHEYLFSRGHQLIVKQSY